LADGFVEWVKDATVPDCRRILERVRGRMEVGGDAEEMEMEMKAEVVS
jgi:hypothetical protein